MTSRRSILRSLLAAPLIARAARGHAARAVAFDLIEAPCNLGLRPPKPGVEPGTWRAPAVLARAGLVEQLHPARRVQLPRRHYDVEPQSGTRIRNGNTLREYSLALGAEVTRALGRGAVPIVVGGDCSILLGCLHGLRSAGGRGLVHVDGHSDFSHPGNYDTATALGAVAGMDLALATGRGEPLLASWPGVTGPLVDDVDAVQIGERDADTASYAYGDVKATAITRIIVQTIKARGVAAAVDAARARLTERQLARAWLHLDLDVLDEAVMPAVDSPGRPGLDYAELTALIRGLVGSGRIAGLDITIYDPDLDPTGKHAAAIVKALAPALRGWAAASP